MAFSLLGHTLANGGGSAVTSAAQNTVGAKLIVLACVAQAGQNVIPTDSLGNVWALAAPGRINASYNNSLALYYCINPTTGAAHTFTFSVANASIGISWWGATGTPAVRDVRASAVSATPGSITPSAANALVLAAASVGGGAGTAGLSGGFTVLAQAPNASGNFGASHAYLLQTTAAVANPTWTVTAGTACAAQVAFIEAQAAGAAGDIFLVAGGGGGGKGFGASSAAGSGGGGGGGVRVVPLATPLAGGVYAVVVGGGGPGGTTPGPGGDSSVAGFTAKGGGVGANYLSPGGDGGSGGGGGGSTTVTNPGGNPTAGQGLPGGAGYLSGAEPVGGGGGGAEEDGVAGRASVGGKGGHGIIPPFFGPTRYGAGGGGMYWQSGTAGPGGAGGGGAGNLTTGVPGTANTGSGGGAGYTAGAVGGSGIVIIRYPTGLILATGGTVTTSGGYTIHTFTASGTFEVLGFQAASTIALSTSATLVSAVYAPFRATTTISFSGDGSDLTAPLTLNARPIEVVVTEHSVVGIVANGPASRDDGLTLCHDAPGYPAVDWFYLNNLKVKPAVGLANASVTFAKPAPGKYVMRYGTLDPSSGPQLLAHETLRIDPKTILADAPVAFWALNDAPAGYPAAVIASQPAGYWMLEEAQKPTLGDANAHVQGLPPYVAAVRQDNPVAYWRLNERPGYKAAVIADGARGYWRLDEASGATVADATGHGFAGTITGGVTRAQPGPLADGNPAMLFDGSSGYVSVPSAILDCGNPTQSYSIEGWINTSNTNSNGALFRKGSSPPNTHGVGWELINGAQDYWMFVRTSDGAAMRVEFGAYYGRPGPALNTWTHIVVTYNGSTHLVTVYVNGAVAWSQTLGDNAQGVAGADIAAYTDTFPLEFARGSYGWIPGLIDDVALYPLVLTAGQVAAHYALRTAPTAGATVARDSIGSLHGTISGSVALGQPGALDGDVDRAMQFDGVTGKIVAAGALTVPKVYTVEAWIKLTGFAGQNPFFSTRGYSTGPFSPGIYIGLSSNHLFAFAGVVAVGNTALVVGQWYHTVFVVNATAATIQYYLNGVPDGTITTTSDSSGTFDHVALAWDKDNIVEFFPGLLDEVAFYAYALTPAQIAAHYTARLIVAVHHPATVSGNPVYRQAGPLADGSHAVLFNNTAPPDASHASVPYFVGLNNPAWTYECFVRLANASYRDAVLADAPVGYWRCGDTTPGVATDSSGHAKHGTYVGGGNLALAQAGLSGDGDPAMKVEPPTNLFETGIRLTNFAVTANVTIEAILKPTYVASLSYARIWCSGPDVAFAVEFAINSGGQLAFFLNFTTATPGWVMVNSFIAVGEVAHVALTWDGTWVRVYKNGAEVYSSNANAGRLLQFIGVTNGQRNWGSAYNGDALHAIVDECAYYSTALSAARIAAHAAALSKGYTLASRMDEDTGDPFPWALNAGTYFNAVRRLTFVMRPTGTSGGATFIAQGATPITELRWYHVAVVLTPGALHLYLDGVDETLTTTGAVPAIDASLTRPLTIGPYGYNADSSQIAHAAFYSRALPASEIQAHVAAKSALVGAQAADSSGHGVTGRYVGGVTWRQPGPSAAALGVTLATGYVETPGLAAGGAFSAEAWIRTTDPTGFPVIVGRSLFNSNGAGWALFGNTPTGIRGLAKTTGGAALLFDISTHTVGAPSYADGRWHHVVLVWDGTTNPAGVRLWVDAKRVVTATAAAGAIGTPSVPTRLGMDSDGMAYPWKGDLALVAVYPVALTQQQIAAHYFDQTGLGPSDLITTLYSQTFFEIRLDPVVALEMELLGPGNGWTIVRDWLRNPGLTFHRGLPGTTVVDLVADIGTLHFTLDNSERNSAGKVGYYSPDHANRRYGFYLNVGVRVRMGDEVRFTGVLSAIDPVPGTFQARTVPCEVTDWMGIADRTRLEGLPVLVNKRGDEVFQTLVDSLPPSAQPSAVEKDISPDTFPYTLDRTRDEQTVLRDEIVRLCNSGLSRVYQRGDGTLVYENRGRRANVRASVDTFEDSHGFAATHDRQAVVNRAQATIHPRLPSTTDVVMYTLPQALPITGDVAITVLGPWTDPSNPSTRVGAVSLVPLVRGTDYVANTLADGSGTDLTSLLTVVAGLSGNATSFTISCPQAGFITKLQQRGKPLYDYGSAVLLWDDKASIAQFGLTSQQVDMPYSADASLAQELAQFIVYNGAYPLTTISGFTRKVDLQDAAEVARSINRQISDRISLTDPVTGLDKPFFINAIDETVGDGWLQTQWLLMPADATGYWDLEVTGSTEMDLTTRLAFGQIIGHTDIAHDDYHNDTAHSDVLHGDVHVDDAHVDTAHGDASGVHGDAVHTDVPHADYPFGDVPLVYWHTDVAHGDVSHADSHNDVSHGDVAHQDVTTNTHTDAPALNFYDHGDCDWFYPGNGTLHLDCYSQPYGPGTSPRPNGPLHYDYTGPDSHQDFDPSHAHADAYGNLVLQHDDTHGDGHADSHVDSGHGDAHGDRAHSDAAGQSAHGDQDHYDQPHADSVHQDVAHADGTGHADAPHNDVAHGDVAHQDVTHQDVAHIDQHGDFHGDLN